MNTQPNDGAREADQVSGRQEQRVPTPAPRRRSQRAMPAGTADAWAMFDHLVNDTPLSHPSDYIVPPVAPGLARPVPRRWLAHGAIGSLLLATIGASGFSGLMHNLHPAPAAVLRGDGGPRVMSAVQEAVIPPVLTRSAGALTADVTPDDRRSRAVVAVRRNDPLLAHALPQVSSPVPATPPAPPTVVVPQGRIIDDKTNLRNGPSTDFDKVLKLSHGDVVTLVGRRGSWFHVQTADGTSGWIDGSLLTVAPGVAAEVAPAADVPTVPPPPATTTAPTTTTAPAKPAPVVADAPAEPTPAPAPKPTPAPAPAPTPQVMRAMRVATWVWPASGDITSPFGYRDFAVDGSSFHNGIDISNSRWTHIRAARSGTVIEAGWCSGYGYCVIMDNGNGITTEYGHMASAPVVSAGEDVAAGQLIGYMGSTYDLAGGGYSTGVHLHFTVKVNGQAVDPLRFLP